MNRAAASWRGWAEWLGTSVALFLLVAAISAIPLVSVVQARFSDSFARLAPASHQRSASVLVMIDDASLNQYGRWPWSRTLLARLTRGLAAQGAQVIGLDILLAEPQDDASDRDLLAAMRENGRTVIVDKIGVDPGGGPRWIEPLPDFARAAAAVGHAQAVLDRDGICRHFPPLETAGENVRRAFSLELARRTDPAATARFLRAYGVPPEDDLQPVVTVEPVLIPISFRRDPLDTISAAAVLQGNSAAVAGRPVIVGFGSTEIADRVNTPLTGSLPAPGVEVHAQILNSVLTGRRVHPLPPGWAAVLLLAVCLGVMRTSRAVRGWAGLTFLLGLAALVYLLGLSMFVWTSRIVPVVPSMLALLLGPPLVYTADFLRVERSVNRQLRELGRWLELRPAPMPSLNGQGLGGRLHLLHSLQAELGASYELHQALLETSSDLVAVFGEDGCLLLRNQRFAAALGERCPLTEEEFRACLTPAPAASVPEEYEARFQGEFYSVRIVPLPCTTLSPSGGTLVTLSSLRARMERDRARGEALGCVTHELRTPLVAIQNFAELMMRYPDLPCYASAPETIFRETKRLLALINSYLDVLRLDAGARPLRPEMVDTVETVRAVFEILRPLADAARIRLSLASVVAAPVLADPPLLTGAILNLVSNAIKYGNPGSEIIVRCAQCGNDTVVSVRNAGEPIGMGDIPRLFEPFYRASQPEASAPGWGLGLAFVKRIAEKHGGSVQARNHESGTTFELHLPAVAAAATVGGPT